MFTGIVEELGEVVRLDRHGRRGACSRYAARWSPPTPRHGDSIAVNGVCLTVVDIDGRRLHRRRDGRDAATAPRSARWPPATRSTWSARPPLATRLGGHLVQGHVDGVGTIARRANPGDALGDRAVLAARPALARYVVEKGSITVDGVSLTVVGGRRRRRSRSA